VKAAISQRACTPGAESTNVSLMAAPFLFARDHAPSRRLGRRGTRAGSRARSSTLAYRCTGVTRHRALADRDELGRRFRHEPQQRSRRTAANQLDDSLGALGLLALVTRVVRSAVCEQPIEHRAQCVDVRSEGDVRDAASACSGAM
jgi:hypothetical protein